MQKMQTWTMLKWAALKDETGASMVEYALLVVLIALVALAAVALTGNAVSTTFTEISTGLGGAGS